MLLDASGRTQAAAGGGPAPAVSPAVRALQLDAEGRAGMRRAGAFNAQVMDFIRDKVVAGVRTDAIDALVDAYTRDHGAIPATVGYHGYPKACCISRNEVVCHGIPGAEVLREGDIVNIDLTSIVDGWFGDQSETFLVGEVSAGARALVQTAWECLWRGIDACRVGGTVIDIGRAIAPHAEGRGYAVVRDYQGHGIGRQFHQDPGVPHFPDTHSGRFPLVAGLCFTIEPMINEGTWRTELDPRDRWTVRTADRKLSAQFEHTILLTEAGPEVLTATTRGPQRAHVF